MNQGSWFHGSDAMAHLHLLNVRFTPLAMAHILIYAIYAEHQATADPTGSFALPPNGLTHKAIFGPCASHEKV